MFGSMANCDRLGFLEVFLSSCSDVHHRMVPAFNAVPSESPKI